ncbi:MAG: peptide deformylase [Bdellovibrionales bacterium]|nr:peptide deformylase [Bdellovibrionales bacterium]
MAILKILTFPDPKLLRDAEPVTKFDTNLQTLVSDMFDTMRSANGIGLAAPQIGLPVQLIIVEILQEDDSQKDEVYAVCNPAISQKKGHARIEEGCLSLPDFYVEVDRAQNIQLTGSDLKGNPLIIQANSLLSICLQHEIDHLNGTLLTSYVDKFERESYRKEMQKRKKKAVSLKL